MAKIWYTYKDFATGKPRRTCGKFDGWTPKTGPLQAHYAIFRRGSDSLFIPSYLLTTDTYTALDTRCPE